MIQENKELLMKDLCARLPYGVKVLNMAEGINEVCELDSIMTSRKHKDKIFVSLTLPDDTIMTGIEMVKPYLRPMSSMTEDERKYYIHLLNLAKSDRIVTSKGGLGTSGAGDIIDYLISHHFDYRGLIPMGLALEAPEVMYKNK